MNRLFSMSDQEVQIPIAEDAAVPGFLSRPTDCVGLVLFAHGSGSSRFSRRNRAVAEVLNRDRIATLLFDLLTGEEHERDRMSRELRFDIPLLTERLIQAIDWAGANRDTADLRLGLFGASAGAAAALGAAGQRPQAVRALVSRGGRPDLIGESLPKVRAPTLLLVGGLDRVVLEMNRAAAERMTIEPELKVIPGATHLFEEAGKLDEVSSLARDWLLKHL